LKSLLIALFYFLSVTTENGAASKEYIKIYYPNGVLKSEGWVDGKSKVDYWKYYFPNGVVMKKGHYDNDIKEGYWYFYRTNGVLKMEGHFMKGEMGLWWLFYDQKGNVDHKCQLKNGVKDGYCLKYKDSKLTSAEKYQDGVRIKQWFDFASFKKENDLSDLR